MGDKQKRTGVRAVSESTIQIDFTYKTIRCRERIKLQPTPANLKRAQLHRSSSRYYDSKSDSKACEI